MLKTLQVLFLTLVGLAVVLFTVWTVLADKGGILGVVITVAAAYLGFLSRFLFRDEHAWIRRATKLWTPLLGTSVRAGFMCLGSLAANIAAIVLLFQLNKPFTINVSILPDQSTIPELKTEPFRVSISIPNAEDPEPVEASQGKATLRIPRIDAQTMITILVTHPGYERTNKELSLEQATWGVTLELTSRPTLVVSILATPDTELHTEEFVVAAWRAGHIDEATTQQLPRSRETVFLAAMHQDWFVSVTDHGKGRIHRSPAIPINLRVKAYACDLAEPLAFK